MDAERIDRAARALVWTDDGGQVDFDDDLTDEEREHARTVARAVLEAGDELRAAR